MTNKSKLALGGASGTLAIGGGTIAATIKKSDSFSENVNSSKPGFLDQIKKKKEEEGKSYEGKNLEQIKKKLTETDSQWYVKAKDNSAYINIWLGITENSDSKYVSYDDIDSAKSNSKDHLDKVTNWISDWCELVKDKTEEELLKIKGNMTDVDVKQVPQLFESLCFAK
ncbi:hypothetical protein MHSWG343_10110 [Candidatus Mycoplasma haematohominis]|uniref:Uncharacterized protein n=1 Tax=Candidatus Mycoplasma haematohominis TaxID=1494318 RepID=A0A478FR72_9MOLU|nr:hypothetical protein MHSWG343_10110 [Candidatus Mycoplasma haemohominis]